MATLTAQILIGKEHTYHGGIGPTHYLFLSENSRAGLILVNENVHTKRPTSKRVWIPTPEHMLEDALLMISRYVLRIPEIIKKSEELGLGKEFKKRRLVLYDINAQQLQLLYDLNRQCMKKIQMKLIVSVFAGSSFAGQVGLISDYGLSHEICQSNTEKGDTLWSEMRP